MPRWGHASRKAKLSPLELRPSTSGIPSSIAVRNSLPRTRLLRAAGYQKPRIRPSLSLFELFADPMAELSVITLANIADVEWAQKAAACRAAIASSIGIATTLPSPQKSKPRLRNFCHVLV